jgi:LPS export ABC transporter protein LptC
MNMNSNKILIGLFWSLLIGILVVGWFFTQSAEHRLPEASSTSPDRFMTNVEMQQFDPNGKPIHFFKAQRLTQYINQDNINMEKPSYLFEDAHQIYWKIKADRGQGHEKKGWVELMGHVRIDRSKTKMVTAIEKKDITQTLLTSKLKLDFNQSLATTQQLVTLKQNGAIIHAMGLRVDLKKGQIKLLSQVKGRLHHTLD